MAKESLRKRLGDPPTDDSLAAISWMQRALAAMAADVLNGNLRDNEKREEMLKIADRMAKLRDPDRIYQAEKAIRGTQTQLADSTPGPKTEDASNLSQQPHSVTARRGRPPRSAIR